jgi:hypothetical protein
VMARFTCADCGAHGELSGLPESECCPGCGSADLRLQRTMADYPKGHPFWDELTAAGDHDKNPDGNRERS